MTNKEAVETIKIAIAEVEWNYPMDYAMAFELACDALEKRIPKKPVNIHKIREVVVSKCPICGEGANDEMKACACCGQLLDWSGE